MAAPSSSVPAESTVSVVPIPGKNVSLKKWEIAALVVSVLVIGAGIIFALQTSPQIMKPGYAYAIIGIGGLTGACGLASIVSARFSCKKNPSPVSDAGPALAAKKQLRLQRAAQIQVQGDPPSVEMKKLDKCLPSKLSLPRLGVNIDPSIYDRVNSFAELVALAPISQQLATGLSIFFQCLNRGNLHAKIQEGLANPDVMGIWWTLCCLNWTFFGAAWNRDKDKLNGHVVELRQIVKDYTGKSYDNLVELLCGLKKDEVKESMAEGLADDLSHTHPLVWADFLLNGDPSYLATAKQAYIYVQDAIDSNPQCEHTHYQLLNILGYTTALFSQSPKYQVFFHGFVEKLFKDDPEKVAKVAAVETLQENGRKIAEQKLAKFAEYLTGVAQSANPSSDEDKRAFVRYQCAFIKFLKENPMYGIAIAGVVTESIENEAMADDLKPEHFVVAGMERLVPGFKEFLRQEVNRSKHPPEVPEAVKPSSILKFLKDKGDEFKKALEIKDKSSPNYTPVAQAKQAIRDHVLLSLSHDAHDEQAYMENWEVMMRAFLRIPRSGDTEFVQRLQAQAQAQGAAPSRPEGAAPSGHVRKTSFQLTDLQKADVGALLTALAEGKKVKLTQFSHIETFPCFEFIAYSYENHRAELVRIQLDGSKLNRLVEQVLEPLYKSKQPTIDDIYEFCTKVTTTTPIGFEEINKAEISRLVLRSTPGFKDLIIRLFKQKTNNNNNRR